MEFYGLQHLSDHHLILCQDHGYCLRSAKSAFDRHLRERHQAKGIHLQAALSELGQIANLPSMMRKRVVARNSTIPNTTMKAAACAESSMVFRGL